MTSKNRATGTAGTNTARPPKDFERIFRRKNLRLTHQRMEIYRALARSSGHPTADKIFQKVRRRLKTISPDTVYRTLATFEKYNLIRRVSLLDSAVRYDTNLTVHHHLVCTRCNQIEDFSWPEFNRIKLPGLLRRWGTVESRQIEIRGLCRKCRTALKDK